MNRRKHKAFSVGRIVALASNTFTELARLRVFYLLLIFALLLIGSSLLVARFSFEQEFQVLKDVSLGAMSIFTSLLAIVATAQLIPRDLEERTIYTILAKPVPRIEYLIGKLAGVVALIFVSLVLMSIVFAATLVIREQILSGETLRNSAGLPPQQIQSMTSAIRAAAFDRNLIPGVVLIFLKGCLLSAATLFVSTFATSNIFTVVVMVFVYFIGHLQATAREYWLQQHGGGWLTKTFLALVALAFPDLQLFNLVDDIVAGTAISLRLLGETSLLGCVYTSIYLFFAWMAFQGREL